MLQILFSLYYKLWVTRLQTAILQELLALGEHIGSVKTGLSEEAILCHLKTRIHVSSLDESCSMDRETETCIICQVF